MKKCFFYILTAYLVLAVVPLMAQQPDFAPAIEECQSVSDVDVCLGDVAFTAGDAGLCSTANDPVRCRNTMSESVELLCQDQSDPQDCFGGWGTQGVESACTYLAEEEQPLCFLVAATESRDFGIIDRHFPEGEARDQANAYVAFTAYEPALVEKIDDNQLYDSAYVMMIAVVGIGQDRDFPDDYCTGLRGDWGGDDADDADIMAGLCDETLALLRAWQQASEEEQDEILQDMLEVVEAGGDEDAMLAILGDRLSSDPIEDAFIRGWCRADEAGDCSQRIVPIFEYNADADTITHYPRNGPPRIYEAWEEGLYRMYYDTETTNADGETEIVRWYGEIIVEGPERISWQFYNHNGNSVGTLSYYIPLPPEEDVAD